MRRRDLGGRAPIVQEQLENRRNRRRFSDSNLPIRQRPQMRQGPKQQQQQQLPQKQLLPKPQPKVQQTRRLKVRNLDENKVSNEDLKVTSINLI